MKGKLVTLIFLIQSAYAYAQDYTHSAIHSHNDYASPEPFYNAYRKGVGSIEADIFLRDGELLVAHTRMEIKKTNTLDSLYFKPLVEMIHKNGGSIYPDNKTLHLLIDLKTKGVPTLNALVTKLQEHPDLVLCKSFTLTISGDVPDTSLWINFPRYIYFDGRPFIQYSDEHLKRISMISDNIKNYTHWDGSTMLPQDDRLKIENVVNRVHRQGKKIRFWGTADNPGVWSGLMSMEVDFICTDQVTTLANYLKQASGN